MKETETAKVGLSARQRAGVVIATIVGLFSLGSVAAFADTGTTSISTSSPGDPSVAVSSLANGLSSGVISTLTNNIVPIVTLLVMFTVIAAVRRHTGAKKG